MLVSRSPAKAARADGPRSGIVCLTRPLALAAGEPKEAAAVTDEAIQQHGSIVAALSESVGLIGMTMQQRHGVGFH